MTDAWPLERVVPLVVVLAAPFALGAYYGWLAIRLGNRIGWVTLSLHLTLMTIAVGLPLSEALTT